MSANPLFSVIMPVYNGEAFLGEAIQSVTDQTFTNWEMIIIDDASTDNSFEIANSFSKNDERIRVMQHENKQNKGVSASRNLGIKQVKGNWIALLDADDKWFEDKLYIQAEIIQSYEGLSMLYGRGERKFEHYSGPKKNKHYGTGVPGRMKDPFLKTLKGFETPTSSVVLNKALVEKTEGFDETMDYSEDTLLFHKMLLFGDLYFIDQPLLEATHHDRSAKQTTKRVKVIQARLSVYLKLLEFEPCKSYKKQLSFQAATTGMERVWKYFFRNPFKYCTVLTSALCKVCISKKMLFKYKILSLFLPIRMVGTSRPQPLKGWSNPKKIKGRLSQRKPGGLAGQLTKESGTT